MDAKQIKQFGPNRLGLAQDKGIPFYDNISDKFIFIVPPTTVDKILGYNPATKTYAWQGVDYIYVNAAIVDPNNPDPEPIPDPEPPTPDPPELDPDPPVLNDVMLRVTTPAINKGYIGDTLLGDLFLFFRNFTNASITNEATGVTQNYIRYLGVSQYSPSTIYNYKIVATIADLTSIWIYNETKDNTIYYPCVNPQTILYIPKQYTELESIYLPTAVTSLTFEDATKHTKLTVIELGYKDLVPTTFTIPAPTTLVDLSTLPALDGFIMNLYTTTAQTEEMLRQLSIGLSTYSGTIGLQHGNVRLDKCQSLTVNSNTYITTIQSKGYDVTTNIYTP